MLLNSGRIPAFRLLNKVNKYKLKIMEKIMKKINGKIEMNEIETTGKTENLPRKRKTP
jgi:tRNA A37 threonylcarbamoyladenosine dehydratase